MYSLVHSTTEFALSSLLNPWHILYSCGVYIMKQFRAYFTFVYFGRSNCQYVSCIIAMFTFSKDFPYTSDRCLVRVF